MAYSQKYTIVQFFEPVKNHQMFSIDTWPLHITLADVFAIELNNVLLEQLAMFAASNRSTITEGYETSTFGEHTNRIAVTLIRKTAELQSLHESLVDLLQANGAVFNSPQFTRTGFVPHSTHQIHAKLDVGQRVHIESLSLIDMYVESDWRRRKILRQFKLQA